MSVLSDVIGAMYGGEVRADYLLSAVQHVSRLRVSHSGSRATGRFPNGSADS